MLLLKKSHLYCSNIFCREIVFVVICHFYIYLILNQDLVVIAC